MQGTTAHKIDYTGGELNLWKHPVEFLMNKKGEKTQDTTTTLPDSSNEGFVPCGGGGG